MTEPWSSSVELGHSRSANGDPNALVYGYDRESDNGDIHLGLHEASAKSDSAGLSSNTPSSEKVRYNALVGLLHRLALQFEALPEATKIKSWGDALTTIFSTPIAIAGIIGTIIGSLVVGAQLIEKYMTKLNEERKVQLSPVQVEMEVKLEKLPNETLIDNIRYKVVIVSIQSRNKSPRDFTVLSTKWVAYAYKMKPLSAGEMKKRTAAQDCTSTKCIGVVTPNYTDDKRWVALDGSLENRTVIANGSLFSDSIIRPSEVLSRQIVLYVPSSDYHYINFESAMPVMSRLHEKELNDAGSQILVNYADSGILPMTLYKCGMNIEPILDLRRISDESSDVKHKRHISDKSEKCAALLTGDSMSKPWWKGFWQGSASQERELITDYEFLGKVVKIELPL